MRRYYIPSRRPITCLHLKYLHNEIEWITGLADLRFSPQGHAHTWEVAAALKSKNVCVCCVERRCGDKLTNRHNIRRFAPLSLIPQHKLRIRHTFPSFTLVSYHISHLCNSNYTLSTGLRQSAIGQGRHHWMASDAVGSNALA